MPPTTQAKPEVPATPATPTVPATPATPATPAAAPKCGVMVAIKGRNGKITNKPCIKDAGHDGKHNPREYNKVDVAGISLDDAKVDTFQPGAKLTVLTDPGTRSDVQKKIDADVESAFGAWKAHGKPETATAAAAATYERDGKTLSVLRRYWINPAQEQAWKVLLRKAGGFHGVQVRIFPVQHRIAKPTPEEQAFLDAGKRPLPWFARDMREKKSKTDAPAS